MCVPADHAVVGRGPALELLLPLLHGHAGVAEYERALAHRAHGRHAHKRLARAARKHDHARPTHRAVTLALLLTTPE